MVLAPFIGDIRNQATPSYREALFLPHFLPLGRSLAFATPAHWPINTPPGRLFLSLISNKGRDPFFLRVESGGSMTIIAILWATITQSSGIFANLEVIPIDEPRDRP